MDKSLLKKQTTVEEIEKKHGGLSKTEADVQELMRSHVRKVHHSSPGSALSFNSSHLSCRNPKVFFNASNLCDRSWQKLAGREGYALVRKGEVVAAICTKMN